MKPIAPLDTLAGVVALVCALTVFIGAALDAPAAAAAPPVAAAAPSVR